MKLSGYIPSDINIELEKQILNQYIKYGKKRIPLCINDYSKQMGINISKILLNLIEHENIDQLNSIFSAFLGIYGNHLSYEYLKKQYPIIEKEVKIQTSTGMTYVDLFHQNDKTTSVYEVKTSHCLLTEELYKEYFNKNNYHKYSNIENIDKMRIPRNITESLLKQLEKLKKYREEISNININVIVMKDCLIDSRLLSVFNKDNINLIILPISINQISNYIDDIIHDIYTYGRNLYNEHNLIPIKRKVIK